MSDQDNKKLEKINIKDLSDGAFYFITSFCTLLYILARAAAANDDSLAFGILRWFVAVAVILFTAYSGAKLIEKIFIYSKYKGEKNHE